MDIWREDKRRFPRITCHTPTRYWIRGFPESYNALSSDISENGIGLTAEQFIAPLSTVMLEIDILSRMLRPVGKIRWASPVPHSDKKRLGIEFIEFEAVEKRFLKDYVDMRLNNL